MKVAIMQPYVFPYLGYFQLIEAVDTFVFYDDVNYIKGGWVNRNKILVQGNEKLITFPCDKASPNRLISEIQILKNHPLYDKQLKSIEQSYKKAPYFEKAFPLIATIFQDRPQKLSDFAISSIQNICEYLGLKRVWKVSSEDFTNTKGLERQQRLLEICRRLEAKEYINPVGGRSLYTKDDFAEHGVTLRFLKPTLPRYHQFDHEFVSALSMIDVLMFNSKEVILSFLEKYSLE